jgi:hypothetical protein
MIFMSRIVEWKSVKGSTMPEMVTCVEKILDIRFPSTYSEFIKEHPGGTPVPDFFTTKKKTTEYDACRARFGFLYNFNPLSEINFLLERYHAINHHSGENCKVPDGIIPFATANGNHDKLCLDYRRGFPPKIVLMDDYIYGDYLAFLEDPDECEEVTEDDYLIPVCDSFGELLDMLEEEPKDE